MPGPSHFAWSVEANLTSPRRGDDFSGMTAETMLLTRLCLTCEPPAGIVSFNCRAMPSVGSPRCARSVGSSRERASRPCSGPFSLKETLLRTPLLSSNKSPGRGAREKGCRYEKGRVLLEEQKRVVQQDGVTQEEEEGPVSVGGCGVSSFCPVQTDANFGSSVIS